MSYREKLNKGKRKWDGGMGKEKGKKKKGRR
jgi:hypothetical protein